MNPESGKYKDYYWLKSESLEQRDVLARCCNFFVGKYLAVTAFDSGELTLSTEEIEIGWRTVNGIAYSPNLTELEIGSIPHFGFDEWYFLESREPIEVSEVFVNYYTFAINGVQDAENFWNQMETINPYAYVADGAELTVVTRDKDLINSLI